MKETFLDKFMSIKGLYASFWLISIFMVSMLIYYTANRFKRGAGNLHAGIVGSLQEKCQLPG